MKTPSHWKDKNLLSNILVPLGKIYEYATACRIKKNYPQAVNKPVICIGNLTAGGTGKTPVCVSVAKLLQQKGHKPAFVSRGYGGRLKDIIVDTNAHFAKDVGDEPLILAKQAMVSINPNRYLAAKKAIKNGADWIIMDDGFQNPSLKKDISLLVFDGAFGIGNARVIPAGPLRENFEAGLKRANGIIIIGEDEHNIAQKANNLPIFRAEIKAIKPQTNNNKIIAFAGIGRPQKFYNSLKELGFEIVKTIDFADHHFYSLQELEEIIKTAKSQNADIFTTSKDFVKIPQQMQKFFKVLEIEINWANQKDLVDFLTQK